MDQQKLILDLFENMNFLSIFDINMIHSKKRLMKSLDSNFKIFKEIVCLPYLFKLFSTDFIIGFYSEYDTCIYIHFDGISYTQNLKAKEFSYPCCGIVPLFKQVTIEDLNDNLISPIYIIQMICNDQIKDIVFKNNYYTYNTQFPITYYNKKTYIFHTPDDFFNGKDFIYIPNFETEDEFKKRILEEKNLSLSDFKNIASKNNLILFLSLHNFLWKQIRIHNEICIFINNKINEYRLIFERFNLHQTSLRDFI